jgi:hypothetical protein
MSRSGQAIQYINNEQIQGRLMRFNRKLAGIEKYRCAGQQDHDQQAQ